MLCKFQELLNEVLMELWGLTHVTPCGVLKVAELSDVTAVWGGTGVLEMGVKTRAGKVSIFK